MVLPYPYANFLRTFCELSFESCPLCSRPAPVARHASLRPHGGPESETSEVAKHVELASGRGIEAPDSGVGDRRNAVVGELRLLSSFTGQAVTVTDSPSTDFGRISSNPKVWSKYIRTFESVSLTKRVRKPAP